VGELDDIKKTVRSISGTVTTVQNEVKELSKKYVDLETHTQGMSNIFDNVRFPLIL
jgi:prophage DNA circulation protein